MRGADPVGGERGTELGGIKMNVLSFKIQAIDYYKRAHRIQSMVKKTIKNGQWVRGHVARIDHIGSIYIVHMTVEEFEGGPIDWTKLPPGFQFGPLLPLVTIGDPRNQRVEFTCPSDHIQFYPIGKRIRVDPKMTEVGKLEGIIVKTSRVDALRPHWKVTVELPPAYVTPEECNDYTRMDPALTKITLNKVAQATGIPIDILTANTYYKETDDMKIYEAVITKNDEHGNPTEIAKVVGPFLAKTDRAAQDAVLVDFAKEKNLAGKELAEYSVRVRTFLSV